MSEPDKPVSWVMREPSERPPGSEAGNPIGLVLLLGLFVLLGWSAGLGTLVFVIGLIVMIFLHELGHFMTARWTGMKSTQFFLGFGPRIWSFRRGEVEYGLRAIPAGAFVRIVGMNNLDPVEDPADADRAYMNATYPRRMLVITAGSMMHFFQAIILFLIAFTLIGVPDPDSPWEIRTIAALETGETPAVEADLQPGDQILAIDGQSTADFEDLRDFVAARPGEEVTLEVLRADGSEENIDLTLAAVPADNGETIGWLGVGAAYSETERLGPLATAEAFWAVGRGTIGFIPQAFSPSSLANLGSLMFEGGESVSVTSDEAQERPVSLVGAVRVGGSDGFNWTDRLLWLATINISVGILNLIPLLPLDGGHAAIATYERVRSATSRRRYHADVAKLMPLTYAVVLLLGFLFVSTVWLDIVRPIG